MKTSWELLEQVLSSYETQLSQRFTSQRALFHTIKISGLLRNSNGASEVIFRCHSGSEIAAKFTPRGVDPGLQEAFKALFEALLDYRNPRAVQKLAPVLRDAASSASWMASQVYQTRLQAWFMSLLVPAFSLIFITLRWENFFSNISTSDGMWLFSLSLIVYAIGAFMMLRTFSRSIGEFGSSNLNLPGGKERFLRTLSVEYGRDCHSLRSLSRALVAIRGINLRKLSGLVRFGLFFDKDCQHSLPPEQIEDLEWMKQGFVFQPQQSRLDWLQVSHERQLSELRLCQMRGAAKVNLRLILLMGTFYLPAFFLILWICGTVVSSSSG